MTTTVGRLSVWKKHGFGVLLPFELWGPPLTSYVTWGPNYPSEKVVCLFVRSTNTLSTTLVGRNKMVSKKTQSLL